VTSAGNSSDVSLDIALAEYEHLREARQVSFDGSGKHFNFYLIIVAASPAALTLSAAASPRADMWISGPLLGALIGLGIVTFSRLLEFDYWSTYYTRGLNHIRAYFLTRAKDLNEYVLLPVTDDRPTFLDRHGLAAATAFINSVLVGLAVGIGAGILAGDNLPIGLIVGLLSLIASWVLHAHHTKVKRKQFQERYEGHLTSRGVPLRPRRPSS
jgi:hypothetical protein